MCMNFVHSCVWQLFLKNKRWDEIFGCFWVKGSPCRSPQGVYAGCSSAFFTPWAHRWKPLKSVTHGQCDAELMVTFPAARPRRPTPHVSKVSKVGKGRHTATGTHMPYRIRQCYPADVTFPPLPQRGWYSVYLTVPSYVSGGCAVVCI